MTPKVGCKNNTIQNPSTMYGVNKVAIELLGSYYRNKLGVDFRALRYPQILSAVKPEGGTGDYACEIFFEALKHKKYCSFVAGYTSMPFLHIEDLIVGTLKFIEADANKLNGCVYNVQGDNFSLFELADALKKRMPEFEISYKPDFRQKIADSWPDQMGDQEAK